MSEAEMTDAEINDLLKRFDCFDPKLQRRIVAHFVCENAKLKQFKEYVHARLDAAGVPADPESPHKAEGCRIGGRLDLVLARLTPPAEQAVPSAQAWEGKYGIITASKKQFHPGEPLFILRATDPLGPDAIRLYADECRDAGCSAEHVNAVVMHASRMEAWQQASPQLVKKIPD